MKVSIERQLEFYGVVLEYAKRAQALRTPLPLLVQGYAQRAAELR